MRAGVIPDPFAAHARAGRGLGGGQRLGVRDDVHRGRPRPRHAYLLFHGLDTVAEIALNGEELGQTDNMFVPHEFSVDGRLRAGENHLRVTFRSALRVGRERQGPGTTRRRPTPVRRRTGTTGRPARSSARRSTCSAGTGDPSCPPAASGVPWSWCTVPVARLGECKHVVEFTDDGKAIVTVEAEVERSPDAVDLPLTLTVGLPSVGYLEKDFDDVLPGPISVSVPVGQCKVTATASLTIDKPRRWNPIGLNDDTQSRHPSCRFTWFRHRWQMALTSYTWLFRIGLRTIELIREPDDDGQGEGFKFRVNGHDVFIKGANWIPEDSFPSRLENEPDHRFLRG